MNNTDMTSIINNQIEDFRNKEWFNPDNISDWYHTFGELYKHRIHLFIALCNKLSIEDRQVLQDTPVFYRWWKSKQHWDWSKMYNWWFIAWIFMEKWKQISYHLPLEYWDKIDVPEVWHSPEWDWHTSDDVLERLLLI